jgi:hypothetical protein
MAQPGAPAGDFQEGMSSGVSGATRIHKSLSSCACLICLAWLPARAQDVQFLPEVDANLKLNSSIRVNYQAKGDREAGDPVQFQTGPSIQFYLKPLIKLKEVTAFDLNDAKSRFLVLDVGFLYVIAPNTPAIDRMVVAATSNYPLKGGFLISDRNRADLSWKDGNFSWRYRNRFQVERAVPIASYHIIPYVASEPYYLSQYNKWSTTALYAGCLFPVGKHVQFDSYYEHQNNTGKKKNEQDEEVGLALHLYFSLDKQ